ncbi:MAG: signal recognition particle-docking protein FtsY [Actinomycetota bacterium]|nr:signal recognition particle-docking protein FtsY [Actinomycetota bacterium]
MDITTLILLLAVVAILLVVAVLLYVRGRSRPGPTATGRLTKTATTLGAALRGAWGSGLDDLSWTEIEEALIAADVGVDTTSRIVGGVRSAKPETSDQARRELAASLKKELAGPERDMSTKGTPAVVLVVGVNGTGKTTTIAKLAHRLTAEGLGVVLAAADTFRAAAGEQLQTWGERVGVNVVSGQEGGDPASVAFDAISSAKAKGTDIVLVDTAGRLHGKKNLMAELAKIHRVAAGEANVSEILLVLDATGGQNGLAQVRVFADTVPVTGIVLTKLDGTAKGGIAIAVEKELGVPVKFVGLGEGVDDLEPFDPDSFVDAMLEQS